MNSNPALPTRPDRQARFAAWCMGAGLFLLICGAKFWLINGYGNATPYWDQWDSEAGIIRASLDGTLSVGAFFKPHNEHHIVFSQLFTWLLFKADHQWDSILEMVAEAPIHAACTVLFVMIAGGLVGGGAGRAGLAVFAACIAVVPFGWENTLWGDQSCFYFSMLFGILSIWLCWRHEPLSRGWWMGAVVAFANLFALASGSLYAASITIFLGLRWFMDEEGRRNTFISAGIFAVITVFGMWITPHIGTPNILVASSFGNFLGAFAGILAWPSDLHWACLVIQAPLIVMTLRCLFWRTPIHEGCWFCIIAGEALWIQAAATAYRRNIGWTASRYCDSWAMLLLVNCACLYFLAKLLPDPRRRWFYGFAALWLFACWYSGLQQAIVVLPQKLSQRREDMLLAEANLRQYLATGDKSWLTGDAEAGFPERVLPVIDSASMRRILPSEISCLQPVLAPLHEKTGTVGFIAKGYAPGMPPMSKESYGSYYKSGDGLRNGIRLDFRPPAGTHEIELQVAGYPGEHGLDLRVEEHHQDSRSIAPPLDPGYNWQTVWVPLDVKSPSFKIIAKDESGAGEWVAFSVPNVSTVGALGRWARGLCANALYLAAAGVALLYAGCIALLCQPRGGDSVSF